MPKAGFVGSENRLIETSRRRKSWFVKNTKEENERQCVNHPDAFWGKSGLGYFYSRCSVGYLKGERCKIKT